METTICGVSLDPESVRPIKWGRTWQQPPNSTTVALVERLCEASSGKLNNIIGMGNNIPTNGIEQKGPRSPFIFTFLTDFIQAERRAGVKGAVAWGWVGEGR